MAKKKTTKAKSKKSVSDLVEEIAERLVMLDACDLPAMAVLSKDLSALADVPDLPSEDFAEIAIQASNLVTDIILEESKNVEKDFETVSEKITALQSAIRNAGDLNGKPGASEEHSKKKNQAASGAALDDDVSITTPGDSVDSENSGLQLIIDDDLLKAFVEQQRSVLPDIDAQVLAFESDDDAEHLAILRRIIHTMKGEAGVCAIVEVETVCHKVEDYMEMENVSADILFDVKDWIEAAVESYANREAPQGLDQLLSRMKNPNDETPADEETVLEAGKTSDSAADTGSSDICTDVISDIELAKDFVAEAQEHFETADENLLILEGDPDDEDAVNAVFRSFHTIKGVSGFLGMTHIGDLAHIAENLLDDIRKGKRTFADSVVDVIFKGLDMLKLMISDLADAIGEGSDFSTRPELPALMTELQLTLDGEEAAEKAVVTDEDVPAEVETSKKEDSQVLQGEVAPETKDVLQQEQTQRAEVPAVGVKKQTVIKSTMKVDADKIDLLLDTIGELVIAESIVSGAPEIKGLKSEKVSKNLSHLNKITRSLQDMGMGMRMVPVETIFRKMARLVRDLAKKSGKEIKFAMEGQETELDKSMVEKLGDPLVHMIRNSVDHGIEDNSEDRVKGGKDSAGHVTLKAFHKGGAINIQIIDDGIGLDKERILDKAIERQIISKRNGMTDQEIFSLIFEAGFSTAKKVTEVSGRGVGMDVVRRNIESLRGQVLIDSQPGWGSTFTIALPLTTAIIDGMLARVGVQSYILPTLSIIESFRPTQDMISTVTDQGEVIMFRGALLPLFRLSELFNIDGSAQDPCEGIVIVVEDSGKQTGVLVDEILGQQQTVIKSLGEAVGAVEGVSGASILADGTPGLIVDISGIIKLATSV